jgi:hypothetical protein
MIPKIHTQFTDGTIIFEVMATPDYHDLDNPNGPDIRVWYQPLSKETVHTITLKRYLELINTNKWKIIDVSK